MLAESEITKKNPNVQINLYISKKKCTFAADLQKLNTII